MTTARLMIASAALALLASGLSGAGAQTMPPTSEELQRDNAQISANAAAQVHSQNLQMQQNMQNDQARQSQLFANQPNAASPYLPPPPRPPAH